MKDMSSTRLRRLVISLVAVLALVGQVRGQASPETTVHYLVYGESGEPFQIAGAGIGTGVVTEIVEAVFEGSGIQLKAVVQPAKRINRLMVNGRYANWLTYGSVLWTLPEVTEKAVFAKTPLFHFYYVLVGTKYSSLPDVVTNASLQGQTIITIFGYSYPRMGALQARHGIKTIAAKSHQDAVKMLLAGRGDYYLAHPQRARWAIGRLGYNLNRFRFHNLAEHSQDIDISLLMDARMPPELQLFIEQRLRQLSASGRLAEIVARY